MLCIIGNADHCNNELVKTLIEPVQHVIHVCIDIYILFYISRYLYKCDKGEL